MLRLALMLSLVCVPPTHALAADKSEVTGTTAIEIARRFVLENLPQEAHVLGFEPILLDLSTQWGVSFRPRAEPGREATGGVPELYIDKQSGVVVDVRRAQ